MNYKFSVHPEFSALQNELLSFIRNFKNDGEVFVAGNRNIIKTKKIGNLVVNAKSFKIPNLINKVSYRLFRKSKAKRSYEYALELLKRGIGTPRPIAFYEDYSFLGLKNSFYISEQMEYDFLFRNLVEEDNFPDSENIIRAFTRFTYNLHEKEIEFLDHSPGNTLIKKDGGNYSFFLVDLNRLRFKKMGLEERMENFSRITPHKEMVIIMSEEYAKLSGESYEKVFDLMWGAVQNFKNRKTRKRKIKKILKPKK